MRLERYSASLYGTRQRIMELKNSIKYSVVIPVFNEAESLQTLHTRLTRVMEALNEPYEIIFVDDGSSDSSFRIIKDLHDKDKNTRGIRFTRNFGQHPAIMAGFNVAAGDIVITLDADLQNPPEEIPKLLEKIDEGCEVVFGVFQQRKHNAFRRAGSWFSKRVLSRIVSADTTNISCFRAIRACAVHQLTSLKEKNVFLSGMLCWTGYKVATVEVKHDARHVGKTKYSTFKLIARWTDMVVSFTDLPLRIAIFGGLLLGVFACALTLYYLIQYLIHGYGVPGFATIVILVTFFAGAQLFSLGILGEYIGRMSREVKNRPEYIIREIVN